MKDEQEILIRFQAGDATAFKLVFDKFYKDICYFTERLTGDTDEGQKIAIDSLEKLFRMHTQFATLVNIRAFLYISARNRCLDYLKAKERDRKRKHEFSYLQDDIFRLDDNTFLEIEEAETGVVKAVYEAVQDLPPQCRQVVEMLYYEKKGYTEIAATLGVTESTVRNQKHRAMVLLRKKLGDRNFLLLVMLVHGGVLQYVLRPFVS
ncbi:RNA polymerase sigma factor [Niastella sp. OAS944]|uniref:RNA polymerase sigma factor n=1 Tax=Niastella sp. OAS944 TaxID=2664089 RepID=UPI0035C7C70B|nr:RNA polymerase sigma-70 factor (ECF subfamily) [Chitinophagaceae bacterium OAS944]